MERHISAHRGKATVQALEDAKNPPTRRYDSPGGGFRHCHLKVLNICAEKQARPVRGVNPLMVGGLRLQDLLYSVSALLSSLDSMKRCRPSHSMSVSRAQNLG